MELILKEWLGADGEYVKLLDDSIIELNICNHLNKTDE